MTTMNVTTTVVIDGVVTFISEDGTMISFKDVEPRSLVPYEMDSRTIKPTETVFSGIQTSDEYIGHDEIFLNARRELYERLGRDSNG